MRRYKDINECLQAGVAREVVAQCVAEAEIIRPERLKGIYDFEQAIWEKFHPASGKVPGLLLPWGNSFGSSLPFRFRYGEVTVWTGYNKHGKSEVLNHSIVDMCWQGERSLVCSLEVKAEETYKKLIRMAWARREVCGAEERETFREKILRPLAEKIWVYDCVGMASLEDVMQVMLYAFQRFGVRQFVLDSLMRFEGLDGEGQEVWNAQKEFMNRLTSFTALYGVHVHLVAHSKKPDARAGEAKIPRRYDIMGSSYISNICQNVIVVWRNRAKQDELEEIFQACSDIWAAQFSKGEKKKMPTWKRLLGAAPERTAPEHIRELWKEMLSVLGALPKDKADRFSELVMEHDAYFIVDAQRGGDGDTPARHLWFHFDSLQFIEVSPWKKGDDRRFPKVYAEMKLAEMEEEI